MICGTIAGTIPLDVKTEEKEGDVGDDTVGEYAGEEGCGEREDDDSSIEDDIDCVGEN